MTISFRSATKQGWSGQTSQTITLPTGHAEGDFLLVQMRASSGAVPDMSAYGYEEILPVAGTVSKWFWKFDEGSESNPVISLGSSVGGALVMASFIGVDLTTPFLYGEGQFNGTASASAAIPGFSGSGHSFLIEGVTCASNGTATVTSGWSGDANASQTSTGLSCLGWKSDSSDNPAGVTMGLNGSFTSVGRQLALNAIGFVAPSNTARRRGWMAG